MTAIRRYIAPPEWWSQSNIDRTVVPYIKSIEQLCLDAGLVKSDIIDNMDTDNITLPSFPTTILNSYNNVCSKKLSFDLNDTMQAQLPIRIEFTFGYYAYNASTHGSNYYPYYNMTQVRVGLINSSNKMDIYKEFTSSRIRSNSAAISDAVMKTREGFPPYVNYSNLESFICVRDGFVMMNILPDFSQSDNTAVIPTTDIFFAIERSFDDTLTPTADDINLISSNSTTLESSSRLYTHVMGKHNNVYTTFDTMQYYVIPTQYSAGKIILYPFTHMGLNYTTKQSPNFCGVNNAVLSPTVELDVSVGDNPPAKFIRTSNNGSMNYANVPSCAVLFKFE